MPRENRSREDELRSKLRIDEDNIDRCLVEQPDYFYQAAEAFAQAIATRDGLKLARDELIAQLDQDVRRHAGANDEKLSETQLTNRIKVLPKVKEAVRAYLNACKIADECEAMKESFQQRSYMLRELNASANARLYNLGIERGAGGARSRIVERGREEISRNREAGGVFERRGSTPVARHRPQRGQDD